MLNQPALVLADEPTGNLDPDSADAVLGLLAAFHRDGGTVLLVTHHQQAADYAQRTILLREGADRAMGSMPTSTWGMSTRFHPTRPRLQTRSDLRYV